MKINAQNETLRNPVHPTRIIVLVHSALCLMVGEMCGILSVMTEHSGGNFI